MNDFCKSCRDRGKRECALPATGVQVLRRAAQASATIIRITTEASDGVMNHPHDAGPAQREARLRQTAAATKLAVNTCINRHIAARSSR